MSFKAFCAEFSLQNLGDVVELLFHLTVCRVSTVTWERDRKFVKLRQLISFRYVIDFILRIWMYI